MQVTFNTQNEKEVEEVVNFLQQLINNKNVAVKRTETILEDTKEEKATPSIPEDKKEPEEPKKTPRKKADVKQVIKVTIDDLKELARKRVEGTSRDEVKGIISKYAPKLAEVKESDYEALATDLKA